MTFRFCPCTSSGTRASAASRARRCRSIPPTPGPGAGRDRNWSAAFTFSRRQSSSDRSPHSPFSMNRICLFVVGLAVLANGGAWAQSAQVSSVPLTAEPPRQGEPPERRTMLAVRMDDQEKIVLDGRLDEPVWQRAVPASDFRQQEPQNGEPATEPTLVRIVYDRTTLYMGVTCLDDEPDRLLRFQRRRDEFLQADDRFMWVMDPFLSAQNGYFFETNPSGLMGDSLLGPGTNNRQWDGIWTQIGRASCRERG